MCSNRHQHGWAREVLDNIFVARLWRSVKYEDVSLNGYATMPELLLGLTEYVGVNNTEGTHQSLRYGTSDAVYRTASAGGSQDCGSVR